VNNPNGCRARDFDNRVGTIELAIPQWCSGSYYHELIFIGYG
jgi:transposase-like protein